MESVLSKLWRIVKYSYLAILIISGITMIASKDSVEKTLPFLIFLSLPLIIILWLRLAKAAFRNYLSRFASYSQESLAEMSLQELKLRRELYRLDQVTDYKSVAKEDLAKTVKQVKTDIKNNNKGFLASFKEGFDSEGGTGNFYGTPGQRIVCINCGQRMSKTFLGWSTSVKCKDDGRKCVPHDVSV